MGQMRVIDNQLATHPEWNKCPHSSFLIGSFASKFTWQIALEKKSSPIWVIPSDSLPFRLIEFIRFLTVKNDRNRRDALLGCWRIRIDLGGRVRDPTLRRSPLVQQTCLSNLLEEVPEVERWSRRGDNSWEWCRQRRPNSREPKPVEEQSTGLTFSTIARSTRFDRVQEHQSDTVDRNEAERGAMRRRRSNKSLRCQSENWEDIEKRSRRDATDAPGSIDDRFEWWRYSPNESKW